jgi:hypothetical protein
MIARGATWPQRKLPQLKLEIVRNGRSNKRSE